MYVDTSFALSLHLIDENSDRTADFMDRHRGAMVVSDLMVLEFTSALRREVRAEHVDGADASSVEAALFDWLQADTHRETPLGEHYAGASESLRSEKAPSRAADALHLSICRRWRLTMLTFDKGLSRAAQAHGVPVAAVYA